MIVLPLKSIKCTIGCMRCDPFQPVLLIAMQTRVCEYIGPTSCSPAQSINSLGGVRILQILWKPLENKKLLVKLCTLYY